MRGKKNFKKYLKLTRRVHSMMEPDCGGPLMKTTSSVHLPLGYSAQVWVVMKGHFVNPSTASSSFGRSDRIMDLSTAFVIIHNHLRYERRHKINVWVLSYHFLLISRSGSLTTTRTIIFPYSLFW